MPNPTPKSIFPRQLAQDASQKEVSEYLADLLEWLTEARLPALRAGGFTDPDLFALRRVARAYRANTLTPDLFATFQTLQIKLEATGLVL